MAGCWNADSDDLILYLQPGEKSFLFLRSNQEARGFANTANPQSVLVSGLVSTALSSSPSSNIAPALFHQLRSSRSHYRLRFHTINRVYKPIAPLENADYNRQAVCPSSFAGRCEISHGLPCHITCCRGRDIVGQVLISLASPKKESIP